jgi:hypothetical protein
MSKVIINSKFLLGLVLLAFVLLTGCQQTQAPKDPTNPELTPTPAGDLVFTPAEIAVAPGSASSVSISVTSSADLSKATFALNQAIDGVTVNFEPASDGKTGELFVNLSETNPEGSQELSIQGSDGMHTWLGSLKLTTSTTASVTWFVNPVTGNDANPGTSAKPFKTLTKALTKVKAGDTVRLATGAYGKDFSGDQFPANGLLVPSGVTIQGSVSSGFPASNLIGNGSGVALNFAGDATVRNLCFCGSGFAVSILATGGKQTLSNILMGVPGSTTVIDGFQVSGGLVLRGTAKTTLQAGAP